MNQQKPLPKPPHFTPLQFVARLTGDIGLWPTGKRWLLLTGLPFVLAWIALFVATGLEARSPGASGWRLALDVAVTVIDPFTVHTWVAVALVVVSVFLVPIVIGAAATLIVEAQIRHMRVSEEDVLRDLADLKARLKALEGKASADHESP